MSTAKRLHMVAAESWNSDGGDFVVGGVAVKRDSRAGPPY